MPSIHAKDWGLTPAGPARLLTLTNTHGHRVSISTYGATLTSIRTHHHEWVAGYDELAGYLGDQPYFGATIGRYGNRIANGRFTLDGQEYVVPINNGPNCLHGGREGFDKQVWSAEEIASDGSSLRLRHRSPAGWQGFPGNLEVMIDFSWSDNDELRIDYRASTDAPTVVNLTNHAYFLIGDAPTVGDLELTAAAKHYLPVDGNSIPTGELAPVAGTPFDFCDGAPLRQGFNSAHPQTAAAGGFDHTLVVAGWDGSLREVATVRDPTSGRRLHCATTEPGFQLYTANFEDGQFSGRDGQSFPSHGAVCLETQHFPDSPNQPDFPSTVIRPGEEWRSTTVYRFA